MQKMDQLYVCTGTSAAISDVPDKIKLLPRGHVKSDKGDFYVDEESYRLMTEAFKQHGTDIVIDYEHQTLQDVQAPAAGWIKGLELTEEAIVATVEWTKKAAEYLKNKEYRYLSPVVICRRSDKKAALLHSSALTNKPAIEGMFPIVNSQKIDELLNCQTDKGGTCKMDLKKIAALLGLAEDATEEDVMKSLTELVKAKDDAGSDGADAKADAAAQEDKKADKEGELVANKTILGLLGLNTSAGTDDVAAQILELKNGSGIMGELMALKNDLKKREAAELVAEALHAGKLTAAQKEWGMEYALKSPDGFRSFLEKAPVTVPMEKVNTVDAAEKAKENVDLKVLSSMGISESDYKKYYLQEA